MKACLFDCGGVIYPYSLKPFKAWVEEKSDLQAVSFKWKELMTGRVSFPSFCRDVCLKIKVPYTPETEMKMASLLIEGKGDFYSQTLQLMDYLNKKNIQMGLISNALPLFSGTLSALPLKRELIFPSYQTGFLKPDKKIFQFVLQKTRLNPKDVLFIDDKKENVAAACACGLQGVVFQKENILDKIKEIMGEKDVGYLGCRRCDRG